MVALEAMACGTPVIASQVGGLAYLVIDGVTGFHVPNNEPQALALKIQELLDNKDLRKEMSKNAFDYAEKNSWVNITADIINVYDKAILSNIPMDKNNHSIH